MLFVVEEYSGQHAWYLGEKIYSLQHKISAKGIPKHLHTEDLYDKLLSHQPFISNSIGPDKYCRIIGNTVCKEFIKSTIPLKRFFLNSKYSHAYN